MAQQDVEPRKFLEHATCQERGRRQRGLEREYRRRCEFPGSADALDTRRMQRMDKDKKTKLFSARVKR
jgi:hypothetical protein